MNNLPENWCVKVTKENKSVINKWKIKQDLNASLFDYDYRFVKNNGCGDVTEPRHLQLITFEQFKKYILMQEEEIIGYKLKDFVNIEDATNLFECELILRNNCNIQTDQIGLVNMAKALKILDIWFEPVYAPKLTLPIIGDYHGSLARGNLSVEYGCKNISLEFIRGLLAIGVESLKIEGIPISRKQLEQIVKYFNNL